jgi:hypothetical protein
MDLAEITGIEDNAGNEYTCGSIGKYSVTKDSDNVLGDVFVLRLKEEESKSRILVPVFAVANVWLI